MAINNNTSNSSREMPLSTEPVRTFSPPSPPSSPPTSSGLAGDTSNVVAFNGAATTNRDESVIAMRASSAASMRSAFKEWRDFAIKKTERKSLSAQAFRMESGYSSEEDEVETPRAQTDVDKHSTKETDRSPTDQSSKTEFKVERVKKSTNCNLPTQLGASGASLAEHAFRMSPLPDAEGIGGLQTSPTTLATAGGQNLAGAGVSRTQAPGGLAEHALVMSSPFSSPSQSHEGPR